MKYKILHHIKKQNKKENRLLMTHNVREILQIFTTTFLGIYFFKITKGNIETVIIYYLFYYLSHIIFRYMVGTITKNNNVIKIYRISLLTNLMICLILLLFGSSIIKFINIFAIAFAISQTLYWTTYEILIYNLNNSNNFKKYFTLDNILKSIRSIIFPTLFGIIIFKYSYLIVFIILSIFAFLSLVLSFFIDKDLNINCNRVNIIKYLKSIKNKKLSNKINFQIFCDGLTSGGVIGILTSLIIFCKIENEALFGSILSIIAIISIITAIISNKKLNRGNFFKYVLPISFIIFIISIPISIKTTLILAIIYSLFSEICNVLIGIPGNELLMVVLNRVADDDYKNDYLWILELFLNLGRGLGLTFILLSWLMFKNINSLYLLFILFSGFYILRVLIINSIYRDLK